MQSCYVITYQNAGQMMEFKSLSLELKADAQGVVSGYGSVFGGVDNHGDTVLPGAFTKSIGLRKPKMLWQHEMTEPVGVWDDVREDAKGLYVQGRLALKTRAGAEAAELIGMGAIGALSIGYRVPQNGYERRGDNRILKEVDLWEVSFVTLPSDQAAVIQSIKSQMTERSFEAMLRAQGFSRWDAKIITADGWKAWVEKRDASDANLDNADQRDAEAELKNQLQQLLKGLTHV